PPSPGCRDLVEPPWSSPPPRRHFFCAAFGVVGRNFHFGKFPNDDRLEPEVARLHLTFVILWQAERDHGIHAETSRPTPAMGHNRRSTAATVRYGLPGLRFAPPDNDEE